MKAFTAHTPISCSGPNSTLAWSPISLGHLLWPTWWFVLPCDRGRKGSLKPEERMMGSQRSPLRVPAAEPPGAFLPTKGKPWNPSSVFGFSFSWKDTERFCGICNCSQPDRFQRKRKMGSSGNSLLNKHAELNIIHVTGKIPAGLQDF